MNRYSLEIGDMIHGARPSSYRVTAESLGARESEEGGGCGGACCQQSQSEPHIANELLGWKEGKTGKKEWTLQASNE